jgi:hypothetical protein
MFGGKMALPCKSLFNLMMRFRVLLAKLVRVPKKALDAKLATAKRRESASKI